MTKCKIMDVYVFSCFENDRFVMKTAKKKQKRNDCF